VRPAVLLSLALAACPLAAQAVNDGCASAILMQEGSLVAGSNAGATTGPDPAACGGANDVWYRIVVNCSAQYVASTCGTGTTIDTVLSVWSGGCGALTLVGCNDNNCAIAGLGAASRVTFTASAGSTYYVSVAGKPAAPAGAFALRVDLVVAANLTFFSTGPGTLGYQVAGPPLGAYFVAITFNAGAFPFGWFFGVDIPLADVLAEYNTGPPFVGLFSVCGLGTTGPYSGLPSGLTVYGVALGFAPGATSPGFISNPATATVP
jgi:hypothetical protein